jgi:hypothetical protein
MKGRLFFMKDPPVAQFWCDESNSTVEKTAY